VKRTAPRICTDGPGSISRATVIRDNPWLVFKETMNTTTITDKLERKKLKRTARKKRKLEHPLKPREYARGSKKRKVKKMARGQSKR